MSETPCQADLERVCGTQGVDVATRWLYDAFRSSARHGPFVRAVDGGPCVLSGPRDALVAVAPAALYKEYRASGADGARVRRAAEALGLRTELIGLNSTGTLEENARLILEWLDGRDEKRIVLISLSKGTSDIKKALSLRPAAFARVAVWISIGGLWDGTPLAQWLLSNGAIPRGFRTLHGLGGGDLTFLREVERRPGGPLDFEAVPPPHMTLIHLLGFALSAHASNWLTRGFRSRLAADGPSDGFMLLKDACRWPGLVYPLWGVDHYFRAGPDTGPVLERLLTMAAEGSLAA